MERKWTEAQNAAIDVRGKDLLISAAAGSGKTATLTERIIRSLLDEDDPADISKLLVVTFTRAAAAELRQRISDALTKALAANPANRHLSEQLIKIGNAKICTIDSFYLDLLRENFSALGLPPSFRIADTAQTELLSLDIMSDTVNRFYDSDTEGFSLFSESFVNIRNASQLPHILLNLYSHVSSYPEGIEFIKKCAEDSRTSAEGDFFESSYGKILCRNTSDNVKYFISALSDAVEAISTDELLSEYYLPSFAYDLTFCRDLLEILSTGGYARSRAHLLSYAPIKLRSLPKGTASELSTSIKDRRTKITNEIRKIGEKSFGLTPDNISKALKQTADITLTLYNLMSEFEKKLGEEKLQRGICDFGDIRRYALRLLVAPDGSPTDSARAISERYSEIYIDEYQDVDRVQDMIFKAISKGNNRFMVGDIKQSIYGFRGAEPHVFASYRTSFPIHGSEAAQSAENEAIFMSNNFRCDENVIRFTNAVCSYLFGICAENIGYTKEDDLVFSKIPPSEDYISPKVEMSIIVPPEDGESLYVSNAENNRAAEARYIVSKIAELMKYEKKADGSPITPSDIAVLFRSKSMKNALKQALDEAGMAYSGAEDDRYFENPDVLLMLSLLNVIDNPHRDIYLAGALRSPIFDFSAEELIDIRGAADISHSLFEALEEYSKLEDDTAHKCRRFISVLSKWRFLTHSLPVDKLIKRIYSSAEFLASGLVVSQNLLLLYEYARHFESGSFRGLYDFIEYINTLIAEGKKFDTASSEGGENAISLMTIHHSKGLEFPVCFLCGTSGEFNREDFKDSLLFEYSAGIAMKLPDGTGFARINTPMREAVASKIITSQLEEEMRVLYVAMTRARERLYITASTSKTPEKLIADAQTARAYSGRYVLMRCKSYLEWILLSLSGVEHTEVYDIEFLPADTVYATVSSGALPESTEPRGEVDEELYARLREKFGFEYPYARHSKLPAKLSVSRLYPDMLDENEDGVSLFENEKKTDVPDILLNVDRQKLSATERGTATHLFMQFCDFERLSRTGVREELSRLIEERFLPASAEEQVFLEELEAFCSSELFSKILGAKQIWREQRFNILLPPSMFSSDEDLIASLGDEMLAVQGVIDLIVMNGDGSLELYDYKTDRLSRAERSSDELLGQKMKTLHSEQLSYYKTAVERLFDKKCDTVAIYSTHAAKTVVL
ncbi:MAG: helicase-exonuclease AddAB subunit AddA [Ruminococcaceae bacterium]|nr:helicase-exonuclease AddAB subunit AddA [Oscillospiraceae bacterium]